MKIKILTILLVALTAYFAGWNTSRMVADKRIAKWFCRMGQGHHTVDVDGEVFSLEVYKGWSRRNSGKEPAEDTNQNSKG